MRPLRTSAAACSSGGSLSHSSARSPKRRCLDRWADLAPKSEFFRPRLREGRSPRMSPSALVRLEQARHPAQIACRRCRTLRWAVGRRRARRYRPPRALLPEWSLVQHPIQQANAQTAVARGMAADSRGVERVLLWARQ